MTPKGIVVVPIRKTYTDKVKGIVKGKLSMKELEDTMLWGMPFRRQYWDGFLIFGD